MEQKERGRPWGEIDWGGDGAGEGRPNEEGGRMVEGDSQVYHLGSHRLMFVPTGDHVRISKGLIWHHVLVVKVIDAQRLKVIHYTGSVDKTQESKYQDSTDAMDAMYAAFSGKTFESAEIIEELYTIIVEDEVVELLRYPAGVAVYEGRKAVQRIRSRLCEREYCLLSNNCEHLINWAITDRSESDQVDTAAKVGKGIAVGAAVGVAALSVVAVGTALYQVVNKGETKKKGKK